MPEIGAGLKWVLILSCRVRTSPPRPLSRPRVLGPILRRDERVAEMLKMARERHGGAMPRHGR